MRVLTLLSSLVFASMLFVQDASSQEIIGPDIPQLPPTATSFHSRTIASLQPNVRSWIVAQAKALTQSKSAATDSEAELRKAIATRFRGQSLLESHVAALMLLVHAEAVSDLRQSLVELKDSRAKTERLRSQLNALRDELRASLDESERAKTKDLRASVARDRANAIIDTIVSLKRGIRIADRFAIARVSTVAEARAIIERYTATKDSLSELSEDQQLRMQMVMDRLTKSIDATSNILKKHSEVASTIVANLK